jgi:hypothetical protein
MGQEIESNFLDKRKQKEIEMLNYEKFNLEKMVYQTENLTHTYKREIQSHKDQIQFLQKQNAHLETANRDLITKVEDFQKNHNQLHSSDLYSEFTVAEMKFKTAEIDYLDSISKKDDIIKSYKQEIQSTKQKALMAQESYASSLEILEKRGRIMRDDMSNEVAILRDEIRILTQNSKTKIQETTIESLKTENRKFQEKFLNFEGEIRSTRGSYSRQLAEYTELNMRLEAQIGD